LIILFFMRRHPQNGANKAPDPENGVTAPKQR